MRKLYSKLCDINLDIKTYKSLHRKFLRGSSEQMAVSKELEWLKTHKEHLINKNKGNAAFWHNGIPPAEVKKQKVSTEQSKRQKHLQFLKKEIEFYSNKDQSKEIKEHLDDLKNQLKMI